VQAVDGRAVPGLLPARRVQLTARVVAGGWRQGFHDMCAAIFGDVGALEAATGDSLDHFFTLADVNSNDRVSFPELVAVFEIEAMRSAELSQWITAQTSALVDAWLGKIHAIHV
jgi:hypothetical protein